VSRLVARLGDKRNLCFLVLATVIVAGLWKELDSLIRFSFREEDYSYIVLIPVISVGLITRQRDLVFSRVGWGPGVGSCLSALGLGGVLLERHFCGQQSPLYLPAATASTVTLLVGVFALCYGTACLRRAAFPLLFLALMVPPPVWLLDSASRLLQEASCQATYVLMTFAGTPVLQKGFVLSMPSGEIEIARQCSGIRSTLGLLIGSLVAGHLFLRSTWTRATLAVAVIPVSIFKNCLRIVSLYWLGIHTDQHFLTGELHRYGGIPFSALAFVVLGPLVWVLRRSERDRRKETSQSTSETERAACALPPHPGEQVSAIR
jgi:exosortase